MKLGDSLVGRSENIPRGLPCLGREDGGGVRKEGGREGGREEMKEGKEGGWEGRRKEGNIEGLLNHLELMGSFTLRIS